MAGLVKFIVSEQAIESIRDEEEGDTHFFQSLKADGSPSTCLALLHADEDGVITTPEGLDKALALQEAGETVLVIVCYPAAAKKMYSTGLVKLSIVGDWNEPTVTACEDRPDGRSTLIVGPLSKVRNGQL